MIRRIFRLVVMAAAVAGAAAAVRAFTRSNDPLPSPATPSGAPWPPPTPSAPTSEPERSVAEPAPPAPTKPTPAEVVEPEPGGVPVAEESTPTGTGATDPAPDGSCPEGFPIKANLKSGIFHSPGQLAYDRTAPDRCYADADAAEADGLRPAKR